MTHQSLAIRSFSMLFLLCTMLPSVSRSEPLRWLPQSSEPASDRPTLQASASGAEKAANITPEQRGDVYLARGEYAAALATYLSITPITAVSVNKIGVAYTHLLALDEALRYYRRALELNPRYAEAYNNEGAVYQGQLKYPAAVKAYKHALKINNRLSSCYRNLGEVYMAEGHYSSGSAAFRKALRLDPGIFDPNRPGNIDIFGTHQQRIETALYLAKLFATMRQDGRALDELRQACSLGFKDRKRLFRDPDLARLRDTPEFHRLLKDALMDNVG